MPNFSPLLFTTTGESCFLDQLNIPPFDLQIIDSARKDLRDALRAGLPNALREKGLEGDICEPRFYIQGSRAYKTLNSPCTTPPQQSDIDDGVYLPLSVMREEGSPKLAIALFFDAVIDVLQPICTANNWQVASKDTCVRVTLSPYAHIDLPLYVIPDSLFMLIKANMESRGQAVFDSAMNSERDSWKELPSNKILLADRKQGWRKSDPMAMKNWFKLECHEKGEQLIRVIRYLKAFRDKQWEKGGPSSILLMAAACPLFVYQDKRDDLALLDVVKGLPAALRRGVASPIDPHASLTSHMTAEDIADAIERFESFARHLDGAINATDAETAFNWVREMLGSRFPRDLHRMKSVSAALPAAMAAVAPLEGPSESVQRTKAG